MNKIEEYAKLEIDEIERLYAEIGKQATFLNGKVKLLASMKPRRSNYNPVAGVTGVKHALKLIDKSCNELMVRQSRLRAYKVSEYWTVGFGHVAQTAADAQFDAEQEKLLVKLITT